MTVMSVWFSLSVGLLLIVHVSTIEYTLDYECTNTGVITVTNPDPSVYIWARINSSDFICPNNVTDGKIIIYDCFDRDLTLLLSDEIGMPNIIKDVHKTFTLACIAIPNEGIFQTVLDKTHIAVQEPESAKAPARFPDLDLDTSVVDPVTGEAKVEAIIGQPFNWTIVGPAEYKIKPLRCSASGGRFLVDTHVDRCTLDSSIMSDFDHIDATQTSVMATVYTFRFPGSNQLKLSCTMLACPSTSIACEFNCTATRRKRFAEGFTIVQSDKVIAHDGVQTEIRTTAEISSQINLHRHRRRTAGTLEASVTTSIRVIGEPNMFVRGYFSGSMSTLKCTHNPIVLLISIICFYGCILLLYRG